MCFVRVFSLAQYTCVDQYYELMLLVVELYTMNVCDAT